jgi:hypothetical protein
LAQASWTGASVAAWVRYLEDAGRTARALVVVVVTPEERGPAVEAPNRETLREAYLDAATRGPALFASTSRRACEAGRRRRADAGGGAARPHRESGQRG